MTWSENELASLAAKAARGAGAPPAQAAMFGLAATRHLAADRPVDDLLKALSALPEGPIISLPLALMRVLAEADGSGELHCRIDTGEMPDLAQSYVQTLQCRVSDLRHEGETLWLRVDARHPAPRCPPRRVEVPDGLLEQLKSLAERTLVPESEASRLAGAGAGLTDND